MSNYQFRELIEDSNGDDVEFPILVHELYNRPHTVIGVPKWASDSEIQQAVSKLEDKLGYELEKPDDYDDARMSDEEALQYYPKRAGFNPITGELIAQ